MNPDEVLLNVMKARDAMKDDAPDQDSESTDMRKKDLSKASTEQGELSKHVTWDANDENSQFILWLVNEVEKSYNEQHLTLASPLVEDAKQRLLALIQRVEIEARLVELDLLEQAINRSLNMNEYKMGRLTALRASLEEGRND